MALISISGIGKAKKKAGARMISESQIKRTTKSPASKKAEKKAVRKAKVQVAKKKILTNIKKAGKIVVKYNPAVATARNAFLVLVSLNALNLAKRLNIMLVKNPQKLMKFWTSLSGNFSSLQKAINTGKNKKAIVGVVAVATTTATATPILIKVMKFLEENGISKEDIKKAVLPIIAKAVDKATQKKAEKQVEEKEKEEAPEEETETTSEEAPEEATETTSEEASEDTSEDTSSEDTSEDGQMGYYC